MFFCAVALMSCGDDKPKDVYKNKNQDAPKAEATDEKPAQDPNATVVPPEELAKAKEIIAAAKSADIEGVDAMAKFNLFCAVCHGKTGNLNVNGAKD